MGNQINPSLLGGYALDLPKVLDQSAAFRSGTLAAGLAPYVVVSDSGAGAFHQTKFVVTNLPVALADTGQGGGVELFDFPVGRIQIMGASGSLAMTTTSTIASTLNAGVNCGYGVGSVVQANGTLATTEQNFLNVATIVSSTVINVAAAVAKAVGVAVAASLDGTASAIKAYLNIGVPTGTDIDGNATVTVSGTITLTWANLG